MLKTQKAFTLLEILIVLTIVVVGGTVIYVSINPSKASAENRNAQRSIDVLQISNAIDQYTSVQGNSIAGLGTILTCPNVSTIGTGAGNVNLSAVLVDNYLAVMPHDPGVGTEANTQYTICKGSDDKVTVSAPRAELGKVISIKR